MKRQALGRGLSALFGDAPREPGAVIGELELEAIQPASSQPREQFDEQALAELARSIEANGVIQPIVVRRRSAGGYEIVAGERRWRAARQLGLASIPAVVRDVAPEQVLELALVENLQREDLNPVEQAHAYEALMRERGLTQEEVAQRVGKERSSVTNMLRILRLPEDVLAEVRAGRLSMGHARALCGGVLEESRVRQLAGRVVADGLSVRQLEDLVRASGGPAARRPRPATASDSVPKDVHDRAAEKKLSAALGTKVEIRRHKKGGEMSISFYSEEDLMRLYDRLMNKEKVRG